MTKGEEQTIRNIIARLKEPRLGGAGPMQHREEVLPRGYEGVSRVYVDTWLIGALECLLPEQRDVDLAVSLSRR